MNEVLMQAILQLTAFLELSDAPDVNPDVAVRQLEAVASLLKGLNQAERETFVSFVRREAHTAIDPAYRDFLLRFPESVGLV